MTVTAPTPPPGGWVSNEVLSSKLDTLTDEVRELRRELVRRDVYDAQRQADHARIEKLEQAQKDSATTRRTITMAFLVAGLSMVVSIVLAVIKPG